MKKILFAAIVAAAIYFLGAQSGREQIAKLKEALRRKSLEVGEAVDSATETARDKVSEVIERAASTTRKKVDQAADSTQEAVGDIMDRID